MLEDLRRALMRELQESTEVLAATVADEDLLANVVAVRVALLRTFSHGGKVLLVGNGGSAAEAQHMAAEYINLVHRDRSALPAINLSADSSVLTAVANDREFSAIFSRQVEALASPGDALMAFSTSGQSENVFQAIDSAKRLECTTILFTSGRFAGGCEPDFVLRVPTLSTPRAQEIHTILGHFLAGSIEAEIA